MSSDEIYGKKYFEGIYANLKKEKEMVLKTFFDLLLSQVGGRKIEKILDLGCGEGEFLEICKEKNLDCFGIDISSYALHKAKRKIKVEFSQKDVEREKLPYPGKYFDAITSFDLLEHLKNPQFTLNEVFRVLKDDGIFFATTPNGDYRFASFFGHFVTGDPTHVNLQGRNYWLQSFKKAGFLKIKTKGCFLFGFPPIMEIRHLFKRMNIPVLTKPIFFPIIYLTTELFFFTRKI